jgi:hypothetical protein
MPQNPRGKRDKGERSVPGSYTVPEEASAGPPLDPDLSRVAGAWPALPELIRRAILALVESGRGT